MADTNLADRTNESLKRELDLARQYVAEKRHKMEEREGRIRDLREAQQWALDEITAFEERMNVLRDELLRRLNINLEERE